MDAAVHMDCRHLIIIDNIEVTAAENQKKGKKDRQQNQRPLRLSKADFFRSFPMLSEPPLLLRLFHIPILNQPQIRIRLFFSS